MRIANRRTLVRLVGQPETRAWTARVKANGGTVSRRTGIAVDRFVLAMKQLGVTDANTRLNLFCGDNLKACLVPLFRGGGADADTNTSFIDADYREAIGLQGATNKSLDTGLTPNSGIGHYLMYLRNQIGTGAQTMCGARDSASSNVYRLNYTGSTTSVIAAFAGTSSTNQTNRTMTLSASFVGYQRTSTTNADLVQNGAALQNNPSTVATVASPGCTFKVMALNAAGTASAFWLGLVGGYSFSNAIVPTTLAYYQAWQAFQTALGRNV